jgi:hypothetical protein
MQFPVLETTTYLVSHSMGAVPRVTKASLESFAQAWAERRVRAWAEGWWTMPVGVGNQLARLIGAPEGCVVMHQSVSVCESVILSSFDFEDFCTRDDEIRHALDLLRDIPGTGPQTRPRRRRSGLLRCRVPSLESGARATRWPRGLWLDHTRPLGSRPEPQ